MEEKITIKGIPKWMYVKSIENLIKSEPDLLLDLLFLICSHISETIDFSNK